MNTALIGYARGSTDDQDLTAQVQAPERLGVTPDRILGEFDFSDEKLQNTTGVLPPKKKAGQDHPRKLGAAKSLIKTLFQRNYSDTPTPINSS